MRTAILVVAMTLAGCGGTDDPAVDLQAECAADCAARAAPIGYDLAQLAAEYCPGFCGGGGECRCLPALWVEDRTVCEVSEIVICPGRAR